MESLRLPRFTPSAWRDLRDIVRAFARVDIVVLAGGTHFHDGLGARSTRILCTHWILFRLARVCRTDVRYVAIGIGPLRRRRNRWLTKHVLDLASLTLVRDRRSSEWMRIVRARHTPALGFDVATMLPTPTPTRGRDAESLALGLSMTAYFSEFASAPELDDAAVKVTSRVLNELVRPRALRVSLFPFSTVGDKNDMSMARSLEHRLGPHVQPSVRERLAPMEALGAFAGLDRLIATRYHALVLGYLAGCPLLVVAYDEKCMSFAEQIGLPGEALIEPTILLDEHALARSIGGLVDDPSGHTASLPVSVAATTARDALDFVFADLAVH
jgi:polysaccharide pyruvyl transferase WcaK-like protein